MEDWNKTFDWGIYKKGKKGGNERVINGNKW